MVDLSWNNTHIALTKIGIGEMPSFDRTFSFSFTDQEDATTSLQGYKETGSPIKVWDEKTGRPYLTLDTERTKYGVGFLAGKETQLNGISFKPFNTQSLYSAVCFDHEPSPITNSKRS